MIADSQWKDQNTRKLKGIKQQILGYSAAEEEIDFVKKNLSDKKIDQTKEHNLEQLIRLRLLFSHKLLIMELMQADFEQRLDYHDAYEIPEISTGEALLV